LRSTKVSRELNWKMRPATQKRIKTLMVWGFHKAGEKGAWVITSDNSGVKDNSRRSIMATITTPSRPPVPPFTRESAIQKVRLAEDAWNTRPGEGSALIRCRFTMEDRSEFVNGRNEIIAFLSRKWVKELDYRLIKELWAFTGNRIAVRFAYEWHDGSGHWYRSYGNENWEFNDDGLMASRFASINDLPISESDRKYHWPSGAVPMTTQD